MHGGKQQLAEPNSPERGGRPRTHGLYARRVTDDMREDIELAEQLRGKLDQELDLSRALLAQVLDLHREEPTGGFTVTVGKVTSTRLYVDVIGEYQDRIARLEAQRKKLDADGDGDRTESALLAFFDAIRKNAADAAESDSGS